MNDQKKWKGYTIQLNERTEEFTARKGNDESTELTDPSMKGIKAKIDAAAKKVFKRFDVFDREGWGDDGEWMRKTVTSVDAQGHAWAVDKEGHREKLGRGDLILATPKNEQIYKKLGELEKQRKALNEQLEELAETFQKVEVEKLR